MAIQLQMFVPVAALTMSPLLLHLLNHYPADEYGDGYELPCLDFSLHMIKPSDGTMGLLTPAHSPLPTTVSSESTMDPSPSGYSLSSLPITAPSDNTTALSPLGVLPHPLFSSLYPQIVPQTHLHLSTLPLPLLCHSTSARSSITRHHLPC